MESKFNRAIEDLREQEHKYNEQKRRCEDATAENCRLTDSNHSMNLELQKLKEALDDTSYEHNQE